MGHGLGRALGDLLPHKGVSHRAGGKRSLLPVVGPKGLEILCVAGTNSESETFDPIT